jgi:DNA-binding response OmpR family regulator
MAAIDRPLDGLAVLVVEDTWHLAEALRRTLERAGARIVGPAGTLAEAERLAGAAGFDAAVLDLELGDHSAEALAGQLAGSGVKVVLLTAFAMPPALAGRVHAHLGKPTQPADLIAALCRPACG